MKSPLSPNDIEVLIWCHCRPTPHERIHAPAVEGSIRMWLDAEMIEPLDSLATGMCSGNIYITTPKGVAMIEALCQTPEPICAWVDKDGRVLLKPRPSPTIEEIEDAATASMNEAIASMTDADIPF